MSDSVSSLSSLVSSEVTFDTGTSVGSRCLAEGCSTLVDQVSISNEAYAKQQTTTEEVESDLCWEDLLGLENGTFRLSNGNKRVVTIDDSHIEILEYSGSKVVRQVEGELDNDSAALATEYYDASGNVELSMNFKLDGLSPSESVRSCATMSRSVQWYDHGSLSRSMDDSMTLNSAYDFFEQASNLLLSDIDDAETDALAVLQPTGSATSLSEMTNCMTSDTNRTQYAARIKDYQHGRLVQDVNINMQGSYDNVTTRIDAGDNQMYDTSTEEQAHDTELRVRITNYDRNGDKTREVRFSDKQVNEVGTDTGETRQSLYVAQYKDGELVQESHGDMTLEEGQRIHLGSRPSITDVLGVGIGDYAASTPQSAGRLLGSNLLEASGSANYFSQALSGASSTYNPAQQMDDKGMQGRAYAISWTNESYQDGEIVSRQEDVASAKKSNAPQGLQMRTGGGLTENASPQVLRSSSYTEESYENGLVQESTTLEMKESLKQSDDGPDKVVTHMMADEGNGLASDVVQKEAVGTLSELDEGNHNAIQDYVEQVGRTLDTLQDVFRGFGRQD